MKTLLAWYIFFICALIYILCMSFVYRFRDTGVVAFFAAVAGVVAIFTTFTVVDVTIVTILTAAATTGAAVSVAIGVATGDKRKFCFIGIGMMVVTSAIMFFVM